MAQATSAVHAASRLRIGLGTFIAVDAEADQPAVGECGMRAAFDAIALVDRLLHPSRCGSDLAAINAAVCGSRIAVHAWTWDILALSQRLHRLSGARFDPCLPGSAGRLTDLELVPRSAGGIAKVRLRSALRLDLGGIGKGFAVDRAIDALRLAGCHAGLVNAGGDLAVFGAREHGVLCREAHGAAITVPLRNAALASSDVQGAARPREHQGYYDGRDGRPIAAGRIAVTAPSAAAADGLTKCLLADAFGSRPLLDAFAARRIGW